MIADTLSANYIIVDSKEKDIKYRLERYLCHSCECSVIYFVYVSMKYKLYYSNYG